MGCLLRVFFRKNGRVTTWFDWAMVDWINNGLDCFHISGIGQLILGLRPANERRLYFVTTSLISWAQSLTQPCDSIIMTYIWTESFRPRYALSLLKTYIWINITLLFTYTSNLFEVMIYIDVDSEQYRIFVSQFQIWCRKKLRVKNLFFI